MRISRPQVRGRGFKVWTMVWSLPLLSSLSGCAGTPWGDTLSGSFPTPPVQATAEQEAPQAPQRLEAEAPIGSPSPGAAGKTGGTAMAPQRVPSSPSPAPDSKPKEPQASKTAAAKPKPPSVATAPSPYRVTIRLPQADPSAPAEGVTEALRTAGIPFEVETIERVNGAAAQPAEAPPAGSALSPSVRPAPPPR
jgi:hypothetical protein